eukprot:GEMP01009778.1.p1 GENE.GEMP01009778.1~~GEMP01009778.1.p1  ORF type:complete len:847 (+),score=121.73 GEMP01009778.1:142-2682(+)
MGIQVLMVAEKPSIAQSLAKALGGNNYSTRRGATDVHEFNGTFEGQSAWIKVTACIGHVYNVDFPPSFNNWEKTDPNDLYNAPVIKDEANPKARIPQHFQKEAKGCQHLVLWLDCDREGENICFEVMDNVVPNLTGPKGVWRAHFSALDEGSLRTAYKNLGFPNKNESDSVDVRQELDLKIGCSFTRFQTRYFQGKYGNLDSNLISYGPCQTPTLWFCVRRHDEIVSFHPEKYYTLDAQIQHSSGQTLDLEWQRGQVFDMPVCNTFKELCVGGEAIVTDISTKPESRPRPIPLNTVQMLKSASQLLGIGPQQAMHIAERLYLSGFITYPRTETSSYPKTFNLLESVKAQMSQPYWGDYARELVSEGLNRAREGFDAGDHPPITPVRSATEAQVGDGWRLFEFISRHFLATVSRDCKFNRTRVTFDINGEQFSVSGRQLIDPGFTKIQKSGEMQDIAIPDFATKERYAVKYIGIGTHETRPPPYLSESDLLGLMEKQGIGTDASMATHINNICDRNYVTLNTENRRLVPTKLGISLVHGYQLIDNELVIPKVRADIEGACTLVAKGKAKKDQVVRHALRVFQQKFQYFVKQIETMDQLFESTFSPLSETGKALSKCGVCNHFMFLVSKRPVRLFCRNCDQTYSLPQDGTIKQYQTLKCPLDNFELVLVSNKLGRTYPVCPMCYNNPPFEGSGNRMNCWSCDHPTCQHSYNKVGVLNCPECGDSSGGLVCLDKNSGPKWKMDCSICTFQIKLFDNAYKISVSKNYCEECGSKQLVCEFKKDKSPLPDGELTRTACIVCDPIFNKLVASTFSQFFRRRKGGGKKGKGKGKGGKRGAAASKDPKMTFDGF